MYKECCGNCQSFSGEADDCFGKCSKPLPRPTPHAFLRVGDSRITRGADGSFVYDHAANWPQVAKESWCTDFERTRRLKKTAARPPHRCP